jgi:chromosome segregation ATPase
VLLEDNKARLNAEQKAYLEENNPNSDRWRQLRQVASQRQQFRRQEQATRAELRALELQIEEADTLLGLTNNPMQTPAQARNDPHRQRLLQLQAQRSQLRQKLQFSRQAQSALEYEYPALAAIPRELGTSPEAIRQVQQSIPKKFDQIRGDIDTVYRDLSRDSSLGLRMDAAVQEVLARIKDPKQAALFAQRVKAEETARQLPAQVLGIASGVAILFG